MYYFLNTMKEIRFVHIYSLFIAFRIYFFLGIFNNINIDFKVKFINVQYYVSYGLFLQIYLIMIDK